MSKKLLLSAALLFITANLAPHAAVAQVQAGEGALAGVVTDGTKAAIPGAKVVLDNPAIGLHKETITNGAGEYIFSPLTVVGGYTVTVVMKGFTESQAKDISTSVGTVISQNFTMAVGAESTTVEVSAGSVEQVQTETSSVSELVDATVWEQSPLNVRTQNQFVGLVAGAAGDSAGTGRGYAVNGARTGTGNFMLDGFDNNDQGLGGGAAGGAVTTISPDAIQEFRVITSVPNAEYGRAGGFATDTVLKSGTNKIHGSAFEYNRIQALAQNNWFDGTVTPHLRDHLVRNQFGGSFGGPIVKGKTYFYATAEFQREEQGNPTQFTGITQDFYNFVKSGNYEKWNEGTILQNTATEYDPNIGAKIPGIGFCPYYTGSNCAGKLTDIGTTGPVFNKLFAQTPQTFGFGTSNFTNIPTDLFLGDTVYLPVNIYGTGSVISTSDTAQNRGTIKLDHKLTNRDQLSFTYSLDLHNNNNSDGGGDSTPGPAYINEGGAQIFGASWDHTFTPNLINQFKAGYLRHVNNFNALGVQGVASMYTADSLYTGFGATSGFPQLFTENQFSYEDSTTYTHLRHTLKGGFRFVRTRNGSSFYNDVNGTLFYWGAAGIMTDGLNEQDFENYLDFGNVAPTATPGPTTNAYGTLFYASASQDPGTLSAPDPYRGYRANEFAAYMQDDYKITSRLFINYGVRWEYFGPPHNFKSGVDSNVYFGTATTLTPNGNPFLPNVPLAIGEQGAQFKCVGFSGCGAGAPGTTGYAPASGTSTIWKRDLNNFAPRVGFSYDTFGNGKLVMRGGFGIGYDRLYNNVYENIRFNGPHFVDNTTGYYAGTAGVSDTLRAKLVQAPFTANNALTGASPVPRHVNQNLKTAYYEQIHVGVETSFLRGYVGEANYIGTLGRQLVGLMNANTYEGRTACASTQTSAQLKLCKAAGYTTFSSGRETTLFGNDNFRTNGFTSNYNALQLSLRKGYAHGLQAMLNYTYGKTMDETSDVFTIKGGATGISTPYNQSHSYGPADFDVRHLATFTVNYVSQSTTHKLLLAGWGFSPILSMQSGTPIYMKDGNSSYNPNKDGTTGTERIIYSGPGSPKNSIQHKYGPAGNGNSGTGWINPTYWKAYTCPLNVNAGLFCDVPGDRNSFYGLRQYNLDAAVSKHIAITERVALTLQASFFDIDGHPEFGNPVGDINSTNFGESTSATNRQGQLSGRIDF